MNMQARIEGKKGASAVAGGSREPGEQRAINVLVVEDNDSERWRLSAMLTKLGYGVREAANADEALSTQLQAPSDIVVSDWRMPGMSGLELCAAMKTEADYRQPYFIMLTGMTNPVDLIAGMEAGADDFIAKPCEAEVLRVRVQAGARIQRLRGEQEHNNRLMRHLLLKERRAMNKIREDLELAAEVQQDLLPHAHARIDGYAVSTLFRPAQEVGGDFFNYFQLGPHHLGFYLLDVSGHGVAAAMMSFSIAYQLSGDGDSAGFLMQHGGHGPEPVSPAAVVATLNERFQDRHDRGRHFTMVYGVLDLRDGSGRLCQAGHPNPLLIDAGNMLSKLGDGGLPAGMFQDASFEDTPFHLHPGDRLFLCSDGVLDRIAGTHGANRAHDELGRQLCLEAAGSADGMVAVMAEFLGGEAGSFVDDVSMLAISRDAV